MNSKRLCKNCKVYYPQSPHYPHFRNWCSPECQKGLAMKALDKVRQKQRQAALQLKKKKSRAKTKELKKEWGLDKGRREEAARIACHEYIRERDKGQPCICCGEPLGNGYHAGHFYESGQYSFVRYREENIHGQRAMCNLYKGGDSGLYRERLIKKIGIERVQWLDDNKSNVTRRTSDDYREIEKYYKDKLKQLKG